MNRKLYLCIWKQQKNSSREKKKTQRLHHSLSHFITYFLPLFFNRNIIITRQLFTLNKTSVTKLFMRLEEGLLIFHPQILLQFLFWPEVKMLKLFRRVSYTNRWQVPLAGGMGKESHKILLNLMEREEITGTLCQILAWGSSKPVPQVVLPNYQVTHLLLFWHYVPAQSHRNHIDTWHSIRRACWNHLLSKVHYQSPFQRKIWMPR